MTDDTEQAGAARTRYFMLVASRIAGVVGAVFGLVLMGRAHTTGPRVLGAAIVLSALFMMATVTRSLARKWRTPPDQ